MKLIRAILATLLFVILLVAVYYIHINYFSVNVVFYAAIIDAILAASIMALILYTVSFFNIFNAFEKLLLIVIFLISGYAVAISVPTVVDRSLSFYILEKLDQRGGGILHNSFERVFAEEYMKEHRLVDVRITEQLESGTIIIKNDCVLLTSKGRSIVNISRYFRKHWLPKKRLLMGQYTDDLTDPFRSSQNVDDYRCKTL